MTETRESVLSDRQPPDRVVLEQIADLARRQLDWSGPVHRQMRLVEDLKLDSIRLLTLAMAVEDHFRICLDEEDEMGISTVGDLVDLIQLKTRSTTDADEG